MKISNLFAASLISLSLAAPAFAGTCDPGVNKRQHKQHASIHQEVESGELTRGEAKSLRADQRAIRAEEHEFKSDGKLTKAERKELHQDQNEASRDIYREKHDQDKR